MWALKEAKSRHFDQQDQEKQQAIQSLNFIEQAIRVECHVELIQVLTDGDLFMVGDFSTETGTSAIVSGVSDLFCFVEIREHVYLSIWVIPGYR